MSTSPSKDTCTRISNSNSKDQGEGTAISRASGSASASASASDINSDSLILDQGEGLALEQRQSQAATQAATQAASGHSTHPTQVTAAAASHASHASHTTHTAHNQTEQAPAAIPTIAAQKGIASIVNMVSLEIGSSELHFPDDNSDMPSLSSFRRDDLTVSTKGAADDMSIPSLSSFRCDEVSMASSYHSSNHHLNESESAEGWASFTSGGGSGSGSGDESSDCSVSTYSRSGRSIASTPQQNVNVLGVHDDTDVHDDDTGADADAAGDTTPAADHIQHEHDAKHRTPTNNKSKKGVLARRKNSSPPTREVEVDRTTNNMSIPNRKRSFTIPVPAESPYSNTSTAPPLEHLNSPQSTPPQIHQQHTISPLTIDRDQRPAPPLIMEAEQHQQHQKHRHASQHLFSSSLRQDSNTSTPIHTGKSKSISPHNSPPTSIAPQKITSPRTTATDQGTASTVMETESTRQPPGADSLPQLPRRSSPSKNFRLGDNSLHQIDTDQQHNNDDSGIDSGNDRKPSSIASNLERDNVSYDAQTLTDRDKKSNGEGVASDTDHNLNASPPRRKQPMHFVDLKEAARPKDNKHPDKTSTRSMHIDTDEQQHHPQSDQKLYEEQHQPQPQQQQPQQQRDKPIKQLYRQLSKKKQHTPDDSNQQQQHEGNEMEDKEKKAKKKSPLLRSLGKTSSFQTVRRLGVKIGRAASFSFQRGKRKDDAPSPPSRNADEGISTSNSHSPTISTKAVDRR